MSLTFDWPNRIVSSDASILDLTAFHVALRAAEVGAIGVVYPVTHIWKALDLGGGALFVQADFVNGWVLKFPTPGNYTIQGNLNCTIVPVTGVYVERKTSAAYITTSVGGSGPTAAEIATAVVQRVIEGSLTLEQALRLLLAGVAGNATGLDSGTTVFKSLDGTRDRIVGSVSNGTRTIASRDGG